MEVEYLIAETTGPGLFPVPERTDAQDSGQVLCGCGIDCSSGACCCYLGTKELSCKNEEESMPLASGKVAGDAGRLSLMALAQAAARLSSPEVHSDHLNSA